LQKLYLLTYGVKIMNAGHGRELAWMQYSEELRPT
jgi:hypothetical protein